MCRTVRLLSAESSLTVPTVPKFTRVGSTLLVPGSYDLIGVVRSAGDLVQHQKAGRNYNKRRISLEGPATDVSVPGGVEVTVWGVLALQSTEEKEGHVLALTGVTVSSIGELNASWDSDSFWDPATDDTAVLRSYWDVE